MDIKYKLKLILTGVGLAFYAAMPAMLRLVNSANRFNNFIINYVSFMT